MKTKALNYNLFLTCEHAGQKIFPELKGFKLPNFELNSHRAYDAGALKLAKMLKKKTKAKLFYYDYTRLILDGNRSLANTDLWGVYGKKIPLDLKNKLLNKYYIPFRTKVYNKVQSSKKPCLHLSVHSMTSSIGHKDRDCDVSLLYDPSRAYEKQFCGDLKKIFELYGLKCRLNYPYKGISDGHCTDLRKKFSQHQYLGVEFELNQKNSDHIALIADILFYGISYLIEA